MMRPKEPEDHPLNIGFRALRGPTVPMQRPERHSELELFCLEEGHATYLIGGSHITVDAGDLVLFWAALPHQSLRFSEHAALALSWVTIPLAWFLQWRLPDVLTHPILHGKAIVDPERRRGHSNVAMFQQWVADFEDNTDESRSIMLLEIQARLRRLARSMALDSDPPRDGIPQGAPSEDGLDKVERMARFMAEHYAEPVRICDVARAVDLHPNYAMTLFRRTLGMSIGAYLTHYRVASAQRLLATSDAQVLQIALDAGFGSASHFYKVFRGVCGQTPRAYRARTRQQ
jgi:AraC-like DNA-binding protein